jgi:NADPH:quinone reductase-like Zn-dependent oxidoreductase
VEQVGSGVTAFKLGDMVYGFGHGAFAEYIAVHQGNLAPKPTNLTFEQAAAVWLAAVRRYKAYAREGSSPASTSSLSAPRAASGPSRCSSPVTWEPR